MNSWHLTSRLTARSFSESWLITLGILQTYPLSESFMIDFLMPYIHRLIDQPPLNHNRQKLISCHCTSGSFQEKKSGPFLVWYFIPGPISCPGTLTHCLLDFWKIVFFKKRTEPPGKKTGSTEEGIHSNGKSNPWGFSNQISSNPMETYGIHEILTIKPSQIQWNLMGSWVLATKSRQIQ